MTYNQAVASAIWTLQWASDPDDAERILALALARGADQKTVDALRREWQALYAETVQIIGGDAA